MPIDSSVDLSVVQQFAPVTAFHPDESYFPCSIEFLLDGATLQQTMLAATWSTDDIGQGPNAVQWLAGDINGDGQDEIIQLWSNHGSLGVFVYGGAGGTLGTYGLDPNLGQGTGAVAWLIGDVDGNGSAEVVQCWANGSSLGMNVYSDGGVGGLQLLWQSDNLGQGPDALTWQIGDINGDGQDEIVQAWNNGGNVSFVVYGWSGGAITVIGTGDNDNGYRAMQWLMGDVNQDGRAELIQLWPNGNTLGIITYGNAGSNGMQTLWSSDNLGQGINAVQWLIGDINGDHKDEIVQCWSSGQTLGLVVYGDNGSGGMSAWWSSSNMEEGSRAAVYLLADINGDGKAELVQGFAYGSALAWVVYGYENGFATLWASPPTAQGSNAVTWLAADVFGNGRSDIVQGWANGGSLGFIVWEGAPGPSIVQNPTQADLVANNSPRYFLNVAPAKYPGMMSEQTLSAPMYYFVREFTGYTEIHYVTLYAFQGGQPCQALRAGTEFDCIVQTMGEHQADLERVTVTIVPEPGGNWKMTQVAYYAHGNVSTYDAGQIPIAGQGMNPLVNASLNTHASYNASAAGTSVVLYSKPLVIAVVDFMSNDGFQWLPAKFIEIGLDAAGAAINDQKWAQFTGFLGNFTPNSVSAATYLNRANLAPGDWAWVLLANLQSILSGTLYDEMFNGAGPQAPGAWPEIRGAT